MLLDDLLPTYDVVERHRTWVRATPRATYRAIRTADLGSGLITSTLLAIRGLGRRTSSGPRLRDLEPTGFRVVAECEDEELVIGVLGAFWTPSGGLCTTVSTAHFAMGPPAGQALAGWNFTVAPAGSGTELRTETRVWCAPDARWKFRAYWLVVRPGSGLIRRSMLAAIRREAERG